MLMGVLANAPCANAQTWISNNVPTRPWSSIACSADGASLVATVYGGGIYSSTNFGATWTTNGAPRKNWVSVASSADGSKLIAGVGSGAIYTSKDAGGSWHLSQNISDAWVHVASSANGVDLFAAYSPGYCYYKSGLFWTIFTNLPLNNWGPITCSADGTKVVALTIADNPSVYSSSNSGASWSTNSIIGHYEGAGAACSADGGKLFVVLNGNVYLSTNYGRTWVARAPAGRGYSIACSADGSKLFTVDLTSTSAVYDVYLSTNSGASWMTTVLTNIVNNTNSHTIWVTSSADGNKLALAIGNPGGSYAAIPGPIYTSQSVPAPQLNLALIATNLAFFWTVPSANFVLQQSADLFNWLDVTNPPALNFSNLQYQITLPPAQVGFFRLATP